MQAGALVSDPRKYKIEIINEPLRKSFNNYIFYFFEGNNENSSMRKMIIQLFEG